MQSLLCSHVSFGFLKANLKLGETVALNKLVLVSTKVVGKYIYLGKKICISFYQCFYIKKETSQASAKKMQLLLLYKDGFFILRAPYKVLTSKRQKCCCCYDVNCFFNLIKINALLCEMNLYVGAQPDTWLKF